MVNDRQPSYPDDDEYRTEQATREVTDESGTVAESSSPWLLIGVALLAIFIVALIWAVLLPALG